MEAVFPCDVDASRAPGKKTGCRSPASAFIHYGPPAFDPPVLICRCRAHPFETEGPGSKRITADEALVLRVMTA